MTYQKVSLFDDQNSYAGSREKFVLEYAPFVKQIADRMAMRLPPHLSRQELISAGTLGLFDALDKFDTSKGTTFRTYAEFRIRGAIIDELRKMDPVSRSARKEMHQIEDAIKTLELRLGREPEDIEIAQELGIDIAYYFELLDRAKGVDLFSLDEILADGVTTRASMYASEDPLPVDELKIKELKRIIAKALASFSEKEQLVISLYYYDELTLKEIARILGLTESRISQIHTKVILKLRIKLNAYFEDV